MIDLALFPLCMVVAVLLAWATTRPFAVPKNQVVEEDRAAFGNTDWYFKPTFDEKLQRRRESRLGVIALQLILLTQVLFFGINWMGQASRDRHWKKADAKIIAAETICEFRLKAMVRAFDQKLDVPCRDTEAINDLLAKAWKPVGEYYGLRVTFEDQNSTLTQAGLKAFQVDPHAVGQSIPIRYSPTTPSQVQIARGFASAEFFKLVVLVCAAGWFLVFVCWRVVRRRARTAEQAA
jgi:hypothetical protein